MNKCFEKKHGILTSTLFENYNFVKQYTCTSLCMNWGRGIQLFLIYHSYLKIYKIQAREPVKYKYTYIWIYHECRYYWLYDYFCWIVSISKS